MSLPMSRRPTLHPGNKERDALTCRHGQETAPAPAPPPAPAGLLRLGVYRTKGYKRADYTKVEVSLFTDSDQLICTERSRLVAVVADHGVSLDVPVSGKEEIPRFVDWVEERFLQDQGSEVRGEDPPSRA